ncbi:unnamed protein product, partial [Hymenolepis diminuta]
LFYNRLASHKGHICARALAWPYPSDSYKATLGFSDNTHTGQGGLLHVLTPFSLSLLLIVASLNTCLVYSTLGVLLHNCY